MRGVGSWWMLMTMAWLACHALQAQTTDPTTAWKEARNQDGVQVFTRRVAGISVKEFKAVVHVPVPPQACLAVINDVGVFTKLFPDCTEARLLQAVSTTERVVYIRSRVPFPFSDRDVCVRYNLVAAADTLTLRLTSAPNAAPKAKGAVRIEQFAGMWQFAPVSGGTRITYQVLTDPAGNVPDWLVNMNIVDNPFTTLQNLRTYVQQEPYKRATRKVFEP